ncbi:MAG: hypothetical protein JWO57_2668 [Pseudonocardiales bacterium]|nr:hypothetical protein [Pseudonocardiales bacterium]
MRRVVAGVALAAVLVLAGAAAATGAPARPTSNVTAFAESARPLPADPVVQAGEPVLVVVTGFAAGVTVSVNVVGTAQIRYAHSDSHGVVRFRFAAGDDLSGGQHLVTFQGPPPPTAAGHSHLGNIDATVPTVGMLPFRLHPGRHSGHGVDAVSVSHAPDGSGSASGLSNTGADIVGPLLVALIALLAGAGALALGRYRLRRR